MREAEVEIRWPSGRYYLHLPAALEGIAPAKLKKKIFMWLVENSWVHPVNKQTFETLDAYIPEWVADHKQQWGDASLQFQRCYRDPRFNGTTKEEKASIKRGNDDLFRKVKSTKKSYERAEKVLTAWTEIKSQFYG